MCGVYVWMREHQYQDLMGGGEMLVEMLDYSEYSIFLLDLKQNSILYTNQMAKQMLLSLGGNANTGLSNLLDFFGLKEEYLKKRYDNAPPNEMDLSYYSVSDNPGKPMELELRIGRMGLGAQNLILIKAKDISFNKQQEKTLERSVALNDSLMLAFPDSLVVLDATGEIKSVRNHMSAQLPLDQFIGEQFELMASQIMTASKQDEASLVFQKTQNSGQVGQLEFLSSLNGESKYFDLRFTPFSNQGEIVAIIRDISVEKKIALALEQSERNYREIFDTVGEGILILAPDNLHLIDLNDAATQLLGYRKEDKDLIPLHNMSKDPAPEDFTRFLKAATQGVQNRMECTLIGKHGRELLLEIAGKLVILGGDFRLLVTLRNIEERTKFQQELQSQALLVKTVSEAIISTDDSFKILSWNPAATAIYGWKASEVLNKELFRIIPTKVLEGSQEGARKALFEDRIWQGELIQELTLIHI